MDFITIIVYGYVCIIEEDTDGTFSGNVPALPDCEVIYQDSIFDTVRALEDEIPQWMDREYSDKTGDAHGFAPPDSLFASLRGDIALRRARLKLNNA
jgi:hypothetical protein